MGDTCFKKFQKGDTCFKNTQSSGVSLTFAINSSRPRVKLKKNL